MLKTRSEESKNVDKPLGNHMSYERDEK